MNLLLLALAFLALCLGIAAVSAIPLLLSIARRNDEIASNLSVSTQILVNRYNAANGPQKDPNGPKAPTKGPNIYPLNGGRHGPSKNDKDR